MTAAATSHHADDMAAAIAWWCDAGLSHDYADDATVWLAQPEAENKTLADTPAKGSGAEKPAPLKTEPVVPIAGDPAEWPDTLAAFRQWWTGSPVFSPGGYGARVPPHGSAGAQTLFLIPEPEAADTATLLAGPQGDLLRSFLAAAGVAPDACYLASALPCAMTVPDWGDMQMRGLDALVSHHIALAQPTRIVAFGRNLLPLLGHDTAQPAAQPPTQGLLFRSGDRETPVLAAPTLSELLRAPQRRRRFWQRWLEWTDD